MAEKSPFLQRLQDYFKGKQSGTRQKRLDEIDQAPVLPSSDSLKNTEDSLRKAFKAAPKTSQLSRAEIMQGLMRGAQMQPDDLQQRLKEKQLERQAIENKYKGAISDEQWQQAQDKLNQIINEHPQVMQKQPEEMYVDQMTPQQLKELEMDFQGVSPQVDPQIEALKKLRGSGTPPRGL